MKYKDPTTGQVIEVFNPELNQELIKGKTLVQDDTINSAIFQSSPTSFQTYNPSTPFPIESLTPEEKKAQDYSSKLIDYSSQLLGESQFKSEQEKNAGLSELETTQDDLTSQLKGLIAESKAIPLQIQEEFKGRGATAGGVAPIETGRLRENAIKSLSVSSQLDAIGGKITSALRKVDRAVAEKYDPIREQIKVASFNLQTILNSPKYSAEVKAKAQAQLDAQNKKKAETDAAAENEKSVKEALIKLIYANPNIDPFTRQKLDGAKDALGLATIASQAGLKIEKKADVTFAAGSLEEFKYLYGRDPKDVAELNAFTAARSAAGRAPEKPKEGSYQTYSYGGKVFQYQVDATGKMIGQPKEVFTTGGTTFGTPTPAEQSALFTLMAQHPTEAVGIDKTKLETDPQYFFWVQSQLENL